MNNIIDMYISDLSSQFKSVLTIGDYNKLESDLRFLNNRIGIDVLSSKEYRNLIKIKDDAYSRVQSLGIN